MIGQRFGQLVVIAEVGRTKSQAKTWRCSCDCGRESVVPTHSLRAGSTKSCGCGMRRTQFGKTEQHPRWTGESGSDKAGRDRAVRWFPDPHPCASPGCTKPAERHHKDRNPRNNVESNIEWLCHTHHMRLHRVGVRWSEEVKRKIAETSRRRTCSPEHRAAVSRGLRAYYARRKGLVDA